MTQRPLTIPIPHPAAQFLRLRRLVPRRDIPYHHHTLHRPYPRRQLLHTLLTPMLRRFDVHYLFAGPEENLLRPTIMPPKTDGYIGPPQAATWLAARGRDARTSIVVTGLGLRQLRQDRFVGPATRAASQ